MATTSRPVAPTTMVTIVVMKTLDAVVTSVKIQIKENSVTVRAVSNLMTTMMM